MKKAKNRASVEGYTEKHHYFPQCIFGKNDKTIVVTAREHFVLHRLLYAIAKKRYGETHSYSIKLGKAYRMMGTVKVSGRNILINSRVLEELRRINSTAIKGDNNPAKTNESREKISQSKQGKARKDMKGKSFMGSQKSKQEIVETARLARNQNIEKRRSQGLPGINHRPGGYKNGPHASETIKSISESRKKTPEKWRAMSKEQFAQKLKAFYNKGTLYRKHGLGGNITRALKARGETYEEYKEFVEGRVE